MQQLADSLDPRTAAVISFNYDVIADIALARHGSGFDFESADAEAAARANAHALDYGVDFVNVEPHPNDGSRFRLLKLHGSFNWLQSRLTGDLYFGGLQKAAGVLKDLRSPHLARIWRRAEECLRSARRVTFIGYSLPGDDLHVKYLLKRAIATRPTSRLPRIVVVNKGNYKTSQVRLNYERFFGKRLVEYRGEGFDRWVRNR